MGTGSRGVAEPELTNDCGEVDGIMKHDSIADSALR